MKNKKLILGITAGIAALAIAGILIAKRRSGSRFEEEAGEARQNFKKKLNDLQRKAQKEYKNSAAETKDAVNAARERANEWVNNANA